MAKERKTGTLVVEVKGRGDDDWGVANYDIKAGTTTVKVLRWVKANLEDGTAFRVIRVLASGTVETVKKTQLRMEA